MNRTLSAFALAAAAALAAPAFAAGEPVIGLITKT